MFLGTLFSLGDRSVWCRFHFFTGWQIHSLNRMCVCVCVCVCAHACIHACMHLVVQLCLTLCNPMDCSPPGFSVHGILQARILEWIAIPFSRTSQPRDWTLVSSITGRFVTIWSIGKSYFIFSISLFPLLQCSNKANWSKEKFLASNTHTLPMVSIIIVQKWFYLLFLALI